MCFLFIYFFVKIGSPQRGLVSIVSNKTLSVYDVTSASFYALSWSKIKVLKWIYTFYIINKN